LSEINISKREFIRQAKQLWKTNKKDFEKNNDYKNYYTNISPLGKCIVTTFLDLGVNHWENLVFSLRNMRIQISPNTRAIISEPERLEEIFQKYFRQIHTEINYLNTE